MKATADIINFDSLPSGAAGLFTTAAMPTGWVNVTGSIGRTLRSNATGAATGGNGTTHTIPVQGFNTGLPVWTSTSHSLATGGSNPYVPWGSHTHTITHGHTTAVSHLPPYINLYVGYKE